MIHKKLPIIRSFCSCLGRSKWPNKDRSGIPGKKAALLLLSALSLSGFAHGQATGIYITPTVTALPYLLTYTGGVFIYTGAAPVKPIPPAVGISTFGSLFGGGFAAVQSSYPATHGGAAALYLVDKLRIYSDTAAIQKYVGEMKQNIAMQIEQQTNSNPCANANVVQLNGINARRASNTIKARRMRNNFPRLAAAETCQLPQEEQAEEAQEELEALNESEVASQDAIEAAESAAEAAEVAAEAAEAAAEAAFEAVDILEVILEGCSLF